MFAGRNSKQLAAGALLLTLLGLAHLGAANPIDGYGQLDELELGGSSDNFQRQQIAPEADQMGPAPSSHRIRRQSSSPLAFLQQQSQQPPAENPIVKFINQLGPQPQGPSLMNGADTLTSLFKSLGAVGQSQQQQPLYPQLPTPSAQSSGGSPQQQQQPQSGLSPSNLLSSVALMSQLSDLMRSTQDQSAKAAAGLQQSAQSAGQQTAQAAQSAQGGIQSALTELGTGLTRLATNNPNLVPDVRQLYQSVSSRLSSASGGGGSSLNGPIVPATNAEQLADNLAKVALQPQPNV